MRCIALLLALIVGANASINVEAKGKEKSFWQRLFSPATPEPKRLKKRKVVRHKEASPAPETNRTSSGLYIVDMQWYANYLEQEAAWGYWIQDDESIKIDNGKVYVPPVVYRHYEDMVKASLAKR